MRGAERGEIMLQIQIIGDYPNSIAFVLEGKFLIISKQQIIDAFNKLYVWQKCNSDCFHSQLYRLICKADDENKLKLAIGFPSEFFAWYCWYKQCYLDKKFKNEQEFFKFVGELIKE